MTNPHPNDSSKRPRMRVRTAGLPPEIDAAIRAGHSRLFTIIPLGPGGLDPSWTIPLDDDETVVGTTSFEVEDIAGEPRGIAVLVVKTRALAKCGPLDDETREAIAQALVDALLSEVA